MSGVEILVVDDETAVRDRFQTYLSKLGYTAECINPGSLALEDLINQITSHQYAKMILLDLHISSRFNGADVFINLSQSWRSKVVSTSEQFDYQIVIRDCEEYTRDFFGYKRHNLATFQSELEAFFTNPHIKDYYNL